MRTAWRLVRKKRLADAFTGEGARLGGGRWNYPGTAVVYVSETLSLAAIELFMHLRRKDLKFSSFLFAIPVEIPDKLKIIEVSAENLPPGWRESPPSGLTKGIGTKWAKEMHSAILRVPSVMILRECNLLLNPKHPDFHKIRIGKPQPFTFDDRMLK